MRHTLAGIWTLLRASSVQMRVAVRWCAHPQELRLLSRRCNLLASPWQVPAGAAGLLLRGPRLCCGRPGAQPHLRAQGELPQADGRQDPAQEVSAPALARSGSSMWGTAHVASALAPHWSAPLPKVGAAATSQPQSQLAPVYTTAAAALAAAAVALGAPAVYSFSRTLDPVFPALRSYFAWKSKHIMLDERTCKYNQSPAGE